MAARFSFQIDRPNAISQSLALRPDLDLRGEPVTVESGESVVYRGTVELGGEPRYVLEYGGRKLYTRDRAALEKSLAENYDAMADWGR